MTTRYRLERFCIARDSGDSARPEIVWSEADLAVPMYKASGGGRCDATIAIRLNIDDGTWDGIYHDLTGHDEIQAIDRAIAALQEARAGLMHLAGATYGRCLTRHPDGDRCSMMGEHEKHVYR